MFHPSGHYGHTHILRINEKPNLTIIIITIIIIIPITIVGRELRRTAGREGGGKEEKIGGEG